jgi:DNA-binding transcriptional ArsR family regulator
MTVVGAKIGKSASVVRVEGTARSADCIFTALGDPSRRLILERLSLDGEVTMRELRASFDISQQAIRKHLNVLENAGLVTCRRQGGERRRSSYYRIATFGVAPLLDWLAERGLLPGNQ